MRGTRRRVCAEPTLLLQQELESKSLPLEGFSELWVEELEGEGEGCLAWTLEGARGCAVSLGWALGEAGGLLLAPGPRPGKLGGQLCDRRRTRSLLDQPSFP